MVPVPSDALYHITIKGFKSIASIEKLELRPINVLIGANGSGKSLPGREVAKRSCTSVPKQRMS
jgi:predicted ATPase